MKREAPADREEKVRDLARKIGKHCSDHYNRLSGDQREVLMQKLDALDDALNAYRAYDNAWDSQLIKVAQNFGEGRIRGEAISTFDSVMDHARGVFAFLVLPDDK